jgi:hypothetical protein
LAKNVVEIKNSYNKKELIIEGERVKFHYDRAERLAMTRNKSDEKKNCFFCKKNASVLLTFINLALIFVVITVYAGLLGKSKNIVENGIQYHLTKRIFGNYDDINFIFQIKNNSKNKTYLDVKEGVLEIYDKNSVLTHTVRFEITKDALEPKESFIKSLAVEKPAKGKYDAKINLTNKEDIKLTTSFSVK